jgi:cytochrome c
LQSRGIRRPALVDGAAAMLIIVALYPAPSWSAGNPAQGEQAFRACTPCHSTEPGRNMTGPSLSGVWERKAGSLKSFHRYSDALEHSGLVWNDETLDAWLRDPKALVPGNAMQFPGIRDAGVRMDLIAYLKAVSQGQAPAQRQGSGTSMGMMGMGSGGAMPDLKAADARSRVRAISYCGDTYTVTTAAGNTHKVWEFNLRFKTDSSANGPRAGQPVLVPQGMQGDRAQLVFANPGEMSSSIKSECGK